MKSLLLLEDIAHTQGYLDKNFQKQLKGKETILLVTDPESVKLLNRFGLPFKTQEDFCVPNTAYDGVSARAYQLAENWYRSPYLKDKLMHEGINLGALAAHEATYLFLWYLRSIIFIQEVVRQVAPAEIWVGTGPAVENRFYGGRERTCYGSAAALGFKTQKPLVRRLPASKWIQRKQVFFQNTLLFLTDIAGPRLNSKLGGSTLSVSEGMKAICLDAFASAAEFFYQQKKRFYKQEAKKNILVSASYSHVAKVMAELKDRGGIAMSYLRESFSVKQSFGFLKQGIFFRSLKLKRPELKRWKSHYAVVWHETAGFLLKDAAFVWAGVSFGELLERKFHYFFCCEAPRFAARVTAARALLKKDGIRGILVEEDVCSFNKTLIQTANTLGIPSLVVQHGAAGLRIGFCPLSATRFAAWGETSRQRLIQWGTEAERVVAVGNPSADAVNFYPNKSRRADKLKAWGLNPQKKLIVLAMFPYRDYSITDFPEAEYFPSSYLKMLKVLSEILQRNEDYQVLIKLHPRDRHESLCRSYFQGNRALITRKGFISEYAAYADCLLTVMSSTVIDVLPFKNPMVLVDLTGNSQRTAAMLEAEIPTVQLDVQAVEAAVHEALNHPGSLITDELIQKQLYALDGNAAKRSADLFEKLLSCEVSSVTKEVPAYENHVSWK